ncbi:hypothetical protein [Paenibacillus donghaensis]|uniref:hypothetical protein n=1 Tax=Paenibacillus donghaensis TaxID=414771 RepID=UPI0012FD141E|nr:hypothetical protein [Paenibacillus donghaensis]
MPNGINWIPALSLVPESYPAPDQAPGEVSPLVIRALLRCSRILMLSRDASGKGPFA